MYKLLAIILMCTLSYPCISSDTTTQPANSSTSVEKQSVKPAKKKHKKYVGHKVPTIKK